MNHRVLSQFLEENLSHKLQKNSKTDTFIRDLRADYGDIISKPLLNHLCTDIVSNVVLKYLISDCKCCNTLICSRNSTKTEAIYFYYDVSGTDHEGDCLGSEGVRFSPNNCIVKLEKNIEEYETYNISKSKTLRYFFILLQSKISQMYIRKIWRL